MKRHPDLVDTAAKLRALCDALEPAPAIAFDTEFISEYTYRPKLCLVQVASGGRLALIDPLAIRDLSPFWNLLVDPKRRTIVHAGREELQFCLRATGRRPARLVDLQIAAGLCTRDYPAGYASLVATVLGHRLAKHDTRSDWSRRPLSPSQLTYAIDDVVHLEEMERLLEARLAELGRTSWFDFEMAAWQDEVEQHGTSERWRRLPGASSLNGASAAIAREIWTWRDQEAERRDIPVRRVLRDDLVVELSRVQVADPQRILLVRGMERGDLKHHIPQLAECIRRGLELPDARRPRTRRLHNRRQFDLAAQLLSSALASICRAANVGESLVGTMEDVRDLIAWRLGLAPKQPPPALATGWRAEVVGHELEDLLAGRSSLRIKDALSDDPLAIEPAAK